MAGNGKDVVGGVNEYGDGIAWIRGSMIGKGSFGRVFLATLKNSTSKYSSLPSVMAVKSAEVSVSGSIQKEKEVLSNLKGCPYIIKCYGEETTIGANGVMAFNLLLEYASGGTLADRIKKSGGNRLPEFEAKVYTRSILRGLKHIHSIGYVHCDLKPDNILLVPSGGVTGMRAKIGDFGLAKRGTQSKKRKLEPYWKGTPMYLSPEAVIDCVQEAPCDVWALGCIVLEMLTGKSPLDGGKEMKEEEILTKIGAGHDLIKIPNEVSKEARAFLKGCFVRYPMFRFTSEMLLNHPFLEGLGDEEAFEELEGSALKEIESMTMVSESDNEFSCDSSLDEWGDGSEYNSFSSWSEEDGYNTDYGDVSNFAEEEAPELIGNGGVIGSSIDADFDQSTGMSRTISSQRLLKRRLHPVSFSIPAGI